MFTTGASMRDFIHIYFVRAMKVIELRGSVSLYVDYSTVLYYSM